MVVVPGLSNPRREREALEGWQRSVVAGQYAQVCYVAGPDLVSHLKRLANGLGLGPDQLTVGRRIVGGERSAAPQRDLPTWPLDG